MYAIFWSIWLVWYLYWKSSFIKDKWYHDYYQRDSEVYFTSILEENFTQLELQKKHVCALNPQDMNLEVGKSENRTLNPQSTIFSDPWIRKDDFDDTYIHKDQNNAHDSTNTQTPSMRTQHW